MKKVILSLILIIVIAIGAVAYYVLTNLDAIVEAAIEKYGSEATQTAVQVDSVRIKLKEGSGAIHGLTVANPNGFALSHAFSLGEIKTDIDLASLKEEPYVIEEIIVRAPQVFVEINEDKRNNLNELKKKLSVGKPTDQPEREADRTAEAAPRLIIKRILFTDGNIKAKVVPLDNKEYDLKLPTLNMRNLGGTPGKSRGASPTELANEIIDRLIGQAKKQIKEKGIDAEVDKLKVKAKAKVDSEEAKVKEKADTKLEEEKQKAEDKLEGLLSK